MHKHSSLLKDTDAGAIVEAAILFPIIIMIFAGLCLLSVYLPTRANLQHATQFAADVLATESGDTWIRYDAKNMEYKWLHTRDDTGMRNVYLTLFRSLINSVDSDKKKVYDIVTNIEKKGVLIPSGTLKVDYSITNYVLYRELHVTATREITPPINLSLVGFPSKIPITVTSSSVVLNGDEFVRDIDLVRDLAEQLVEEYNLQGIVDALDKLGNTFNSAFGINVG